MRLIIGLLGLLLISTAYAGMSCYPVVDLTKPQYIIGYGSLMNEAEKRRTDPYAGKSIPVEVSDYRRAWLARGGTSSYLSAALAEGEKFNAVIYRVEHEQVPHYDERESVYCRHLVPASSLEILTDDTIDAEAQVWIYIVEKVIQRIHAPIAEYPITQSYVDAFFSGCLHLEAHHRLPNFAKKCIETTRDWSSFWINDRANPVTERALLANLRTVDKTLSHALPEYFPISTN